MDIEGYKGPFTVKDANCKPGDIIYIDGKPDNYLIKCGHCYVVKHPDQPNEPFRKAIVERQETLMLLTDFYVELDEYLDDDVEIHFSVLANETVIRCLVHYVCEATHTLPLEEWVTLVVNNIFFKLN